MYPFEVWLKYLVTVTPELTPEQVKTAVSLRGFPAPDTLYITDLRKRLLLTRPQPFSAVDSRGKAWLQRAKIHDMYSLPPDLQDAQWILGQPRVRLQVESQLLAGMPIGSICAGIQEYFGKILRPEALMYYQHYFWNTEALRVQDWHEFFKKENAYPYRKELRSLLYASNPRAVLAQLGGKLDMTLDECLDDMAFDTYTRYASLAHGSTDLATQEAARIWGGLFLQTASVIKRSKASADMAAGLLEAFKLRLDEAQKTKTAGDLRSRGDVILLPAITKKEG